MNNETLVSHIEEVQKVLAGLAYSNHFDMGNWLELGECGTTLCLAGIAGALQLQLNKPTPDALNGHVYIDNYFKGLNKTYGDHLLQDLEIRNLACRYLILEVSNDAIFYVNNWHQVLKQLYYYNKLWPKSIALKEINEVFTTLFPERLFNLSYFRCLAGYLALELYKRKGPLWWYSSADSDEASNPISSGKFLLDYQDAIVKFDQLTQENESK